jgi:CRISPR/Cas system-associated exonuclease Cas4 (RecB family)
LYLHLENKGTRSHNSYFSLFCNHFFIVPSLLTKYILFMTQYYNAPRTKNIYDPNSTEPYKLSRTKIELFMQCPRCFYLDRRLGVDRPPGFPFTLNSAVDTLLKKEFDILRASSKPHPLIEKYGIDAVPAQHDNLDMWRNNFKGVQYLHKKTNLLIFGAIDDLWQSSAGEYIVVDYKSTSKNEEITELNKEWQNSFKRQMEIYQWLLRKNGYEVSDMGYFLYCNAKTDLEVFDGKLEFDITLVPYKGNDSWVEKSITDIYVCLQGDIIPPPVDDCDYCAYIDAVDMVVK